MYVKDRMTKEPFAIGKDTTISKALDIMATHDFHRLPVVDSNNKLIGLITEGEISANTPSKATSLSIHELNYLLSKTLVESIMIKEVITTHGDALLEEAASIMRKNNVGCLPVVKDGVLIGIITQNTIFEAFIDMMGYYQKGTRFVVEVQEDKAGILAEIGQIFYDENISVSHMAVYHHGDHTDVVIRANTFEADKMTQLLQNHHYQIVSVIMNKK